MSAQREVIGKEIAGAQIGASEHYLTLWVALCIIAGLGHILPVCYRPLATTDRPADSGP